MKKIFKNPILYIFLAITMLFCGSIVVAKPEKTNAINQIIDYTPKQVQADYLQYAPIIPLNNSLLGDFTVKGKSDSRDDDLIVTFKNTNEINLKVKYTIVGSDMALFEEFKEAFKEKYTPQTAIGKLVAIELSSDDADIERRISGGFSSKVSIFFPTNLLSKEYSIVIGDSPSLFKARGEDFYSINENYITFENYTLYAHNYVALIYNNAYKVVWICLAVFVVIFAGAIFLKIRKMHKEDPEYYASIKREKQQQKYYKQKAKQKQQQQTQYRKSQNQKRK